MCFPPDLFASPSLIVALSLGARLVNVPAYPNMANSPKWSNDVSVEKPYEH